MRVIPRPILIIGLVLLLMPFQILPTMFPYMDKVGHFMIMSILCLELSFFISVRKAVMVAFLIGVGVEYSQHFMASRSASLDDVLANTAGILFAWFFLHTFKRRNTDEKTE